MDAAELDTTGTDEEPAEATRLRPASSADAFEVLYRDRFDDLVQLAAMISGSRAVAEDVVQDAFANLFLRLDRIEFPEAYLRRSVVNGCSSRFRRHRREDLVDTQSEQLSDGAAEPTERLDLERRLAALPARQRAAVVLRVHLGLSEADAADALRCRPGTVGSLLHRALTALRIEQQEEAHDVDR